MEIARSIRTIFEAAFGADGPARRDERRYDVIVVGAGVSGLAAAQALQASGLRTLTLEARDRIGGRVWTDRTSATPIDIGASWVHGANGNPIARLLREAGASLHQTNFHSITLYRDGRKIGDSKSIDGFYRYIERRKDEIDADESLQATFERYVRQKRFDADREFILRHIVATDIETEFGTQLSDLSLEWFNEDEEYKGGDFLVASGYDALIEPLARGLDIRLRSKVSAIRDSGAGVVVSTDEFDFHADHAIVTVPLGVLQSDAIKFMPALSKAKTRALQTLGMGNLHKTFLEFAGVFWDETQTIDILRGEPKWREFINVEKEFGRPVLLALHSGEAASRLRRLSKGEIAAEAFAVLRTAYPKATPPLRVTTTAWEDDPYSRGSYSFLAVGASLDMYEELAKPQGRVCFAGEHTNRDYPATVHGAYLSGQRAAKALTRKSPKVAPA